MHQILLVFSMSNLVFAAHVVREIDDAHSDMVVPVAVRNVAVMLKDRHQSSELDTMPLPSSPPPPDEAVPSHALLPPLDGSMPLHGLSLSDGPADLRESPSPPGGPAALAVSSLPGGTATLPVVPASDMPVPVPSISTSTSQPNKGVTHDMLAMEVMDHPSPEAQMKLSRNLVRKGIIGGVVLAITGGLLLYNHLRQEKQE